MRSLISSLSLCLTIIVLLLSGCKSVAPGEAERAMTKESKIDEKQGPEVKTLEQTMVDAAKAAFDAADFRKAAENYAQLVVIRDSNPTYRIGYADSLRQLGDTAKAHDQYQMILTKDADNLDAIEGNGLTYMVEGKFTEAVAEFKKVMAKDALRWRTINALGICLTMTKRFDEAIPYFQTALEISPNNPAVLNNIGLAYVLNGKEDEAVSTLEKASQSLSPLDPKREQIDLNLALFNAAAGKLDEAERLASLHLKDAALANNMGLYASLAKNKELARSYLNQALAQSPSYYQKAWDNLHAIESKDSLAQDE